MKIINKVFQNWIHVSLIVDNINIYIYKMEVLRYRNLINVYDVYMLKKFKHKMLCYHPIIHKGPIICI